MVSQVTPFWLLLLLPKTRVPKLSASGKAAPNHLILPGLFWVKIQGGVKHEDYNHMGTVILRIISPPPAEYFIQSVV